MSHISKTQTKIKDLGALAKACTKLGLRFIPGARTFGGFYGNDNECQGKITIPGTKYEIGLAKNGDSWDLNADHFTGAVSRATGENYGKLLKEYGLAVVDEFITNGDFVVDIRQETQNGGVHIELLQIGG